MLANENGPFGWEAGLIHSELRHRNRTLIAARFSFVFVSWRREVHRADQLVQIDYELVVDWDIEARKSDDLVGRGVNCAPDSSCDIGV